MKVTHENIKDIKYIANYHDVKIGKQVLDALLFDIAELNNLLVNKGKSNKQIYIEYIDEHTKYSPERTDPCPDYYGLFRLRFLSNTYETIVCEMDLNTLDNVICALVNFVEFK